MKNENNQIAVRLLANKIASFIIRAESQFERMMVTFKFASELYANKDFSKEHLH